MTTFTYDGRKVETAFVVSDFVVRIKTELELADTKNPSQILDKVTQAILGANIKVNRKDSK